MIWAELLIKEMLREYHTGFDNSESGSKMEELFEMANFDSYKEDNRREVKKAEEGFAQ